MKSDCAQGSQMQQFHPQFSLQSWETEWKERYPGAKDDKVQLEALISR